MKGKKITPWIAVGLVSGLLVLFVLFRGDNLNSSIYSDYMGAYGDKDLPYALFVLPDGKRECVSFWWSDKQEAFVLFAPGFWNEGDRIRIYYPEGQGKNTGLFSYFNKGLPVDGLTTGIQDISFGEKVIPVIVMKASPIPTMMIELDSNDYSLRDGQALLEGDQVILDENEAPVPINETYKVWSDARVRLIDRDGKVSTAGLAEEIRVRGNTSADWPKQPYQLTMKDSTDFLGMGSAKKWNLLSNWSDRTLLRNKITYDMAMEAGLEYSPESQFVDLYINGQYQGCYQLSEKVEIGKNRVNITNLENLTIYKPDDKADNREYAGDKILKTTDCGSIVCAYETELKTDDLTGGYLLELERPSRIKDSLSYFITRNGQPLTIRSPKYADLAEAEYISSYWQGFEDALFSEDGVNPGNGLSYLDFIDLDSFVKKYLIEEIVRNYDASSTSQYFYKEADNMGLDQGLGDFNGGGETDTVTDIGIVSDSEGSYNSKLYAGPVWDYDMSLGNTIMNKTTNQRYVSSIDPYGIYAAFPFDDFSIWAKLYEKPEFYQAVQSDYRQVYLPLIRALLDGRLVDYADQVRDSGLADLMRWGRLEASISDMDSASDKEREQLVSSWMEVYDEALRVLDTFLRSREHYLTAVWIEGKTPRKIYLDGGEADMYVAWVEVFEGEKVPMPVGDPDMEGYRFVGWNNGYTGQAYDFDQIYQGEDLYLEAAFEKVDDGGQ